MTVPLFTLDDVTPIYQDGIDSIILLLGKICRVVCDGEKTVCPNCFFDAASNAGTGVYNGTGPVPFTDGMCPVCHNSGYDPATAETTVDKRYLVKRNIKPFQVIGLNLTRPTTIVRLKGFVTDLQPLLAMRYVIPDVLNQTAMQERYEKLSDAEYTGSIVSGRYFQMYLKRTQ